MKTTLKTRLMAATLLVPLPALAFALPAAAQEERLETVVVSGAGPERSVGEIIGNATVLEREDVLETLSASLGDSLDGLPGVASTNFGQGAGRPILRGLGAERVLVLTNGIGVIDASAASPDHQVTTDGIDAEAIEILRGPAALAYGGQAIGGVVNVIDGLIVDELPDAPSADLFTAYNSVSEGTELAGRGQIAAGPLVFTLSGSMRDFGNFDIPGFAESSRLRALEAMEEEEHDDEDGDEDHDHDEEEEEQRDTVGNSFVETATLAAGLSYVGERGYAGIAVRQQTAEYGLPGHGHEHGEEEGHGDEDHDEEEHEGEEEEEENPFIDLEQVRVDLRAGIDLNAGILTGLSATAAISDYKHTEFEAPGEPGTVFSSDGYEARLEAGTAFADFEGAVGLQVVSKSLEALGDEAFLTPTDTDTIGVFAYQTREFDSGVGIEGGLRFDSVELANQGGGDADFSLISGSAGVHRHFSSGWFIGASAAYTERAPDESELFAFGPHLATDQFEVGNATLDKERGLNLEGVARWSNENVTFGVNVFATDFSDFIYLTPSSIIEDGEVVTEEDGLPVFAFAQEDAEFIGGEIYTTASFDDGLLGAAWDLSAGLDFVSAELSNNQNVPFIPPMTLNASASAEWGAWELGTAVTVAGDQDDPAPGELETDGFVRFDVRGEVDLSDYGVGRDGTELFVEVRNVTDEEIRQATSPLKDLVPSPGRNVRVGLRVAF